MRLRSPTSVLATGLAVVFPLVFVLLATATPTYATPMLRLSTDGGGTWTTITDQLAGDFNPTPGAITFVGPLTGFPVNVTTGITKPALGSTTLPSMDLNSVDIGAGALIIEFSDTAFGPFNSNFSLGIGGTVAASGTLLYAAFLDPGNANFVTTTTLGLLGPFGPGAFSGSTSSALQAVGFPYSLTQRVTISQTSQGATSFNATLTVPAPAPLVLLGIGLLSLGLLSWRRNRQPNCVS